MPSAAEQFLIGFHARHAGATTRALGDVRVRCAGREFASSYALLAAQVPEAARDVLDLACGDGYLLSLLARERPALQLTGVDMSSAELDAARVRLQGRAHLHEGRAQALPFAAGSFDTVSCHLALMLMEQPAQVAAEIHRVLRRGGRMAAVIGFAMPSSPALDEWRRLIKPRLASASGVVPLGDAAWRSPEGLQLLLEGAAFTRIAQASAEGELHLAPQALWDWLMLMYDAHFLDAGSHGALHDEYMAAVAPRADGEGKLRLAVAWRLVTAARD